MNIKHFVKLTSSALLVLALACATPSCSDKSDNEPDDPNKEKPEDKPNTGDGTQQPQFNFQSTKRSVTINTAVTYQTMEGIGASDCWLPATIGRCWTSNRGRLAELLFSQEIRNGVPRGIGLSMWRVNLGAGTEELGAASGINDDNIGNRAPSYWTGSGYDWNKCPGQRYFMEQAKQMGVENFVLFSNSPLVQYTKNGKGVSTSGGSANLKDDCYDDYADYMATVAEHFVKQGYNVSHISPVNEPQYDWNGNSQEGSGWQNTQVGRIARELSKALDNKGIPTNISLGEAGAWDCLYQGENSRHNVLQAFYTPGTEAYIGDLPRVKNICAHSYYTDGNWDDMRPIREKAAQAAESYGATLWQTEWSMLVNGPNHYGDNLNDATTYWDIASYMSMVMHNDFTKAGVTSWSYWTSMSVERWSQLDRFMLINCVPAGGNYSNDFTAEGSISDFPTLWVLGNYSLFVRPGYKRIYVKFIESEQFFGNGWVSPDGKRVVFVYTNRNKTNGVQISVNSTAFRSNIKSITTYTSAENMKLQQTKFPANGYVELYPNSVTTVVYELE